MKKLLQFFIPTIWVLISLYTISFLLEMMNEANSIQFGVSILGILLVIYLSIITKLGLFIININFKPKIKKQL